MVYLGPATQHPPALLILLVLVQKRSLLLSDLTHVTSALHHNLLPRQFHTTTNHRRIHFLQRLLYQWAAFPRVGFPCITNDTAVFSTPHYQQSRVGKPTSLSNAVRNKPTANILTNSLQSPVLSISHSLPFASSMQPCCPKHVKTPYHRPKCSAQRPPIFANLQC